MKHKLSISIDTCLLKEVEKKIMGDSFKNKSHFIELAVLDLLDEVQKDA